MRDQQNIPDEANLLDTFAAILRSAFLLGVFVLFAISAYYSLHVFLRLGALLADPASATESVDAIAKMIDADKLTFSVIGDGNRHQIEPGKIASFGLLFLLYLLWAVLPIQFVSVCGRILLRGVSKRGKASGN
ncbi:MAG: hypothetical protein CMJ59_23515 [Planctomycetaceae bacterium]|nr:hypothetical protein [Planctomycetaceae bacterium]